MDIQQRSEEFNKWVDTLPDGANVYLEWVKKEYGLEHTKALSDGQRSRATKDWDIHRSLAPEKTVGAYLGLTPNYPQGLGNLRLSCTPNRKRLTYHFRSKAASRRVVQGCDNIGH